MVGSWSVAKRNIVCTHQETRAPVPYREGERTTNVGRGILAPLPVARWRSHAFARMFSRPPRSLRFARSHPLHGVEAVAFGPVTLPRASGRLLSQITNIDFLVLQIFNARLIARARPPLDRWGGWGRISGTKHHASRDVALSSGTANAGRANSGEAV